MKAKTPHQIRFLKNEAKTQPDGTIQIAVNLRLAPAEWRNLAAVAHHAGISIDAVVNRMLREDRPGCGLLNLNPVLREGRPGCGLLNLNTKNWDKLTSKVEGA